MPTATTRLTGWLLAWLIGVLAGTLLLARAELTSQREAFETDARIAHRLLSQRAVQLDAVLAMLNLLQPPGDASRSERLLPAIFPHVLQVQRFAIDDAAVPLAWRTAAERARAARHAVLAGFDAARARYQLVGSTASTAYLLEVDLRGLVPAEEWPWRAGGPVHAALLQGTAAVDLEPGERGGHGWTFTFTKHLASPSQPFDLIATRVIGWSALPWWSLAGWTAAWSVLLLALRALQQQRIARQRAEERLRLGQIARLNTMGELAAGLAHELNQPLTAVLASTQAAQRMLAEQSALHAEATPNATAATTGEAGDSVSLRTVLGHAAAQARRAADVIARLRRMLERPDDHAARSAIDLEAATRNVLDLLEPECRRLQVTPRLTAPAAPVRVLAEAVALGQVIHNLVMNALQALEGVPAGQRQLMLSIASTADHGTLQVADNGPGIAADALPRIFEPFFSTRPGGLGLGLNLCETLTAHMGGRLTARNGARGALFLLSLPHAGTTTAAADAPS